MGALKLCPFFPAAAQSGRQWPIRTSGTVTWEHRADFPGGAFRPKGATELGRQPPTPGPSPAAGRRPGRALCSVSWFRSHCYFCASSCSLHTRPFLSPTPGVWSSKTYHIKCGFRGSAFLKSSTWNFPLGTGELPTNIKIKWFEGHLEKKEIRG